MKNLLSLLLLLTTSFCIPSSHAQTTLFTDDFEGLNTWQNAGTNFPNTWIVGSCIASTGTKSAYITSGGSTNDCTPTGFAHHGYVNSPPGSSSTILYRTINSNCFTNLQIEFDLTVQGETGFDYLDVVYSTDNGNTWISTSANYTFITPFQQFTLPLPPALNGTTFLIGFRFTYNNTTVGGIPPAIDNVRISGTTADVTPPVAICPANFNFYANASCTATIPDLPPSVTVSDNCTPNPNLVFTQTPTIGSTASGSVMATVTVTDLAGNQTTCNTQLVFIDTIRPTLTCPPDQSGYPTSCNFTVLDYSGLASISDNCTPPPFLFAQNPAPGSTLSLGAQTVTLTVQDASGNPSTCAFTLNVIDTIGPTVNCPPNQTIPYNLLCSAQVIDYLPLASATDNCSASNILAYGQVPPPNSNFTGIETIQINVTDFNGNTSSCQFLVTAIDTTGPTITCVSDTALAISAPCAYTIPNFAGTHSAIDYCTPANLVTVQQIPLPGTAANDETDVQIIYTDTAGNSSTCITHITPIDLVAPEITCPTGQTVTNVSQCTSTVPDFTTGAVVTDNCSGFTLTQNPPIGTIVTSGINEIYVTVTDVNGNQQTCATTFTVLETIAPTITCPGNITTCNPIVSYPSPNANDNCLFQLVQTDMSGFTDDDLFPIGITQQTYTVIDSSGNSASCSFSIEVIEYPDTAQVTQDTMLLCSQTQTTISALPIASGTGTWSVATGSGNFTNPNSITTNIQNLSFGVNLIVWTVSSPLCGAKNDTLTIIVTTPPAPATIQDTLVVCTTGATIIQGNVPTNGIGTWSSNTSAIVFADIHSPITNISGTPEGYSQIIWTIDNGACVPTADTGIVYRPAIASINTPDTSICIADLPFVLSANPPLMDQSPIWSNPNGLLTLSSKFNPTPSIINGTIGANTLIYRLSHPICGNTQDTVIITLNACGSVVTNIPTVFTPNNDGENDFFYLPNLDETFPNAEVVIVNRWGSVVYESVGYTNPWDGNFKGEPLPMGTYFYQITSPSNDFEVIKGSISIIR